MTKDTDNTVTLSELRQLYLAGLRIDEILVILEGRVNKEC